MRVMSRSNNKTAEILSKDEGLTLIKSLCAVLGTVCNGAKMRKKSHQTWYNHSRESSLNPQTFTVKTM